MTDRLDWTRDGHDWPNRTFSRFVDAGGLRWHVQQMGTGPALLLLHGTGASTHSWRALMPLLAETFCVTAPDLPGHGFTSAAPVSALSLPGMARATAALLRVLGVAPEMAAGHSAGAAILVRMSLDGAIAPRRIVSLNGALLPLGGVAGRVFSPLAKLLAQVSAVPKLFAWRADDPAVIERLLKSTGSTIDATGAALYARLARNPGHVAAALGMMAQWDLPALERDLAGLRTPLTLVAGGNDLTIPASDAFRVRTILPSAEVTYLRGLGHLAHEERPAEIASLIHKLYDGRTHAPAAPL